MINAVVLVAGGLDSLLIAKLMQQTNVSFKIVHFDIGLTYDQPIVAGQRISKYFGLEDIIRNGILIDKIDIAKEFYSHILNIKDFKDYNACLEYKVFILKKAYEYMKKYDAQFIVTGDVLDQRPMIQGKHALEISDQMAGIEGLVFRPLSAKLLDSFSLLGVFPILESISYSITGFSTQRYQLAKELGIVYTDSKHDKFKTQELDMGRKAFEIFEKHQQINTAHLNRVGIHFKIGENVRCVIGRTPFESNYLKNFYQRLKYKLFSFGITEPRFLFGFVYGTIDSTNINEELVLKIFRSVNQEVESIQLYNENNEYIGDKKVNFLSSEDLDNYILHSNDLFCPIIFQGDIIK